MQSKCVYSGNHYSVEVLVLDSGSSPTDGYLSALSDSDRRKVDVLFERLCCHGRISNKEHFRKVEGTDLFEFKRFQIRLLGFYTRDKRFVICHAVTKKQDKHDRQDLKHAQALRDSYMNPDGN